MFTKAFLKYRNSLCWQGSFSLQKRDIADSTDLLHNIELASGWSADDL